MQVESMAMLIILMIMIMTGDHDDHRYTLLMVHLMITMMNDVIDKNDEK